MFLKGKKKGEKEDKEDESSSTTKTAPENQDAPPLKSGLPSEYPDSTEYACEKCPATFRTTVAKMGRVYEMRTPSLLQLHHEGPDLLSRM